MGKKNGNRPKGFPKQPEPRKLSMTDILSKRAIAMGYEMALLQVWPAAPFNHTPQEYENILEAQLGLAKLSKGIRTTNSPKTYLEMAVVIGAALGLDEKRVVAAVANSALQASGTPGSGGQSLTTTTGAAQVTADANTIEDLGANLLQLFQNGGQRNIWGNITDAVHDLFAGGGLFGPLR